jgi:hypothetical protein
MTRWRTVVEGPFHLFRLGDDLEHVIHARGFSASAIHKPA